MTIFERAALSALSFSLNHASIGVGPDPIYTVVGNVPMVES